MLKKTFFLIFLFYFGISNAASICIDNGAVFDDDNLCRNICSTCSSVSLVSNSSGVCDKTNYRAFVYFNNKTYAISKSVGFWEDFNNLAVVSNQDLNALLAGILAFYKLDAWIGLYDPQRSQSFNYIDKSRFIWVDGSALSYDNFSSGEPNNYVANEDIGLVPVLGEHWVVMLSNGTWNDIGYHQLYGGDYSPKRNAIVQWNGPLDCVNVGVTSDRNQSPTNLIDNVCNGQTPCYVCTENGSNFRECNIAKNNSGQTVYSCPIGRVACSATYKNPICPKGGNFNANTGKCEAQPL